MNPYQIAKSVFDTLNTVEVKDYKNIKAMVNAVELQAQLCDFLSKVQIVDKPKESAPTPEAAPDTAPAQTAAETE